MTADTVIRFRPAWASYWPAGLAGLGVFALWQVQRPLFDRLVEILGLSGDLAPVGLVVGLVPIVAGVLYHRYTRLYEIADGHRLRVSTGLIARNQREFVLSDQVQADVAQSISGRLLGFGTVTYWTGDDRSTLQWTNVSDPTGVVSLVRRMDSSAGAFPVEGPAPTNPQGGGSTTRPTLKEAKRKKRTHLGMVSRPPSGLEEVNVDTPFGRYVDNGDGTVTHAETGLTIIRAPWGMLWNGRRFDGEAILMSWHEAVNLFGCGSNVAYSVGGTSALGAAKLTAAAFQNGYRNGACTVDFAGFDDWRLPTADELERMSASTSYLARQTSQPDWDSDQRMAWRWGGPGNRPIVEQLYPELAANGTKLWSATGIDGRLAWAFHGTFSDIETRHPMGVMFVRQGSKRLTREV